MWGQKVPDQACSWPPEQVFGTAIIGNTYWNSRDPESAIRRQPRAGRRTSHAPRPALACGPSAVSADLGGDLVARGGADATPELIIMRSLLSVVVPYGLAWWNVMFHRQAARRSGGEPRRRRQALPLCPA